MLTIITTGATTAEQAAVAVAQELGIPCVVVQPRRHGPDRRSYRQCLQESAVVADGSLILGDTVPPGSDTADVETVLLANKPSSQIATRVALMFRSGPADTREWIRKHKIRKLHITGRAPKAMATKFLRAVLADHD